MRPIISSLALIALLPSSAAAQEQPSSPLLAQRQSTADEPGICQPTCRTGYVCQAGQCVSLCNPPCPAGDVCIKGECESRKERRRRKARRNYFGVGGGGRLGLNDAARGAGEIRVEFGSRYGGMQVGPAFGEKTIGLRSALFGQMPLQPSKAAPFYIAPSLAFGYTLSWIDDGFDTQLQELFIAPGVRLQYVIANRLMVILDLIQVEINFLQLRSDRSTGAVRLKEVPVQWGLGAGIYFLY